MFWPRKQKRYENLKSSFVDIQKLLEELKEVGFSGFLELIFNDDHYYVLKKPNQIEKIYVKNGRSGRFTPTNISLPEIQSRSLKETAIINVHDVDPDQLEFLSGCLNAQPLYSNLSSEFTDFEKLLQKIHKDRLHGYLEILFQPQTLTPAYLFYQNGDVISTLCDGRQLSDKEGVQVIALKLKKLEAKFNVYEIIEVSNSPSMPPEVSLEEESHERKPPSVSVNTETKPEKDKTPEELSVSKEDKSLKTFTKKAEISVKPETLKATVGKSKTDMEKLSIFPYLDFVEAVIRWVEMAVNKNMGRDYFSKAFKKGLLNVSDKYPFLDPFLADFTYADGKINFTSEANAIEFLKGIYDAIETLFEEFTLKERENIQRQLKQTLRNLERNHHEDIEILRVRTLMPTLFQ